MVEIPIRIISSGESAAAEAKPLTVTDAQLKELFLINLEDRLGFASHFSLAAQGLPHNPAKKIAAIRESSAQLKNLANVLNKVSETKFYLYKTVEVSSISRMDVSVVNPSIDERSKEYFESAKDAGRAVTEIAVEKIQATGLAERFADYLFRLSDSLDLSLQALLEINPGLENYAEELKAEELSGYKEFKTALIREGLDIKRFIAALRAES